MSPSRCDKRRLSLALIAVFSNASYSTIAPILPLEIDAHDISDRWVSLIFLAFSIGSSVAPPLVARHFESVGTLQVMIYSMLGMSLLFWCVGYAFYMSALLSVDGTADDSVIVLFLTVVQFFMGAFFSAITTGYYSLATLVFVEKESAMSSIEAAVGAGYILGPIIGSIFYEQIGYQYAYTIIALVMMAMALVTWKFFSLYLKHKSPEFADDGISLDLEAQNGFANYDSFESADVLNGRKLTGEQPMSTKRQHKRGIQQPSTISLLKFPKILIAATTIMWINVSWTFLEPLLAKRLDSFGVGRKGIGIIFSLSNIVYVPTVFFAQYLPLQKTLGRHQIISISTMLTPIAVLFIGSKKLPFVILGIILLGLLPTPVWIMLLPFMQEESAMLFPEPNLKRCANDVTAGIYNLFMTLGQVIGYTIGPLMGSYGFALTAQVVASLIFLQSTLFYFGTKVSKRKKRGGI